MSGLPTATQLPLPKRQLPQLLSTLEVWGFGLSGLLLWLGPAPAMNADLGFWAMFVWIPAAIVGILLNFQVKQLGTRWPLLSGGTPNYTTQLLEDYPFLARYGAIGYFLGWVSVPSMNAIILTDFIAANLDALGIACPETLLKISFTAIPFIVAYSGTRALSILHLFFTLPAIGFLLVLCAQGMGWLAISPNSPGLLPAGGAGVSDFTFTHWAKWFFLAVYAAYGCETASSFVADNRKPLKSLHSLTFAATLLPIVYIGGSWLLMRLATEPSLGGNAFLNLVAAAQPFWGSSATFLVTFLIASGCLLSSATAVSNSPRVLYQLACDRHMAPVFAVVSRRSAFGAGLTFTFALSLVCLLWGNVERVVMVTGTGYLCGMISIHLGLWLRRGNPEVLWPRLSLLFALTETIVLLVGGLAWSWQDLLVGLLMPIAVLVFDRVVRRVPFPPFQPQWWTQLYRRRSSPDSQDFVARQILVLLLLVCSGTIFGWQIKSLLDELGNTPRLAEVSSNLLVLLLLTVSFVAVAIACWTSLPQAEAIIEAREQSELLFQVAQDAIVVLDERGAIRQVNPATTALFKARAFDLMGHHLGELLQGLPEEIDRWPPRSEQTFKRNDKTIAVELSLSNLKYEGVREYLAILRDVTEQKQAQEALQRSEAQLRDWAQQLESRVKERTAELAAAKERADAASQAKSDFLASMSHELRTPLNGILGYAQILQQSNLLPERERHGVNIIYRCGSHLLTLINDILDLSKIEAQKMELSPNEFHFPAFLQGVVEICRVRAQSKQIAFDFQFDPDLPMGICADEKRLRQVLLNLLGNAIKFTDGGGVAFKVSAIEKRDTTADESSISCAYNPLTIWRIRFQIEDTGVGMNPEQLEQIFLPFEQVGKEKYRAEGTGLGLTICQKILGLMNSQIEVNSQLDRGSTFGFELTLVEASEWVDRVTLFDRGKIVGYQGKRRTLAIIDDRWENRSVIVNLLEPLGFEMLEAAEGRSGLEIIQNSSIDLAIADLEMPVMDGFQLLAEIREREDLKDMLVLVSSASVLEVDRYKSLEAGGNDFLPKPVQAEELLSKIQKLLKLEWIYEPRAKVADEQRAEAKTPTLDVESEGCMPPIEDLEKLLDLARQGLVNQIEFELDRIQEVDKQWTVFIRDLQQLAKGFQLKQIRERLQVAIDEHPSKVS